jgi:hypothetical protein
MRAGSADDRYPREGVIGHARWLSENSEFATDSSLEEAVSSEPVSEPKFPASWENAGNFVNCRLNGASKGAKKGAKSVAHGPIPYSSEQGIFCTLAGN